MSSLYCCSLYTFLILLIFVESGDIIISEDIIDPPRPSFPLNTLVQGWWYCGAVSPYCISQVIVGSQGMIQGWWKFNPNDNFMDNYREDSVINNTEWMFNREYATRTELNEYSIATSLDSNFTCYSFPGATYINRNWLNNATYIGISTFDNINAYEFKSFWEGKGYQLPFTGYVDVNTQQILGWKSLGYTYRYYNVLSLDTIDPQIFLPPSGVKCQNMTV